MNKTLSPAVVVLSIFLSSCESRFPVEKRFWTPDDYKKVWYEISFNTPKGEEYPRFSNPETAAVVRKIVDAKNYEVILEDNELGLNYRTEVSGEFFEHIVDLAKVYSAMDVQDKYIYPEELAEIRNFFLGFQIVYFRVGNENIASQSDDRSTISRNQRVIIENFTNHLDNLRKEKAYGQYAVNLANGITTHFPKLIETFPEGNYSAMLATAKTIKDKLQTPELKQAISALITKLESLEDSATAPV